MSRNAARPAQPPFAVQLRAAGPPSPDLRRALAALALKIAARQISMDSAPMLGEGE